MKRLRRIVLLLILAAAAYVAFAAPPGSRSLRVFEPERLAALELDMWKAYYDKQSIRLFRLLVIMLREQYSYSWVTATRQAFHLARAADTFASSNRNYEVVLPDLEAAYGTARDWLEAEFDPEEVAKAELAWWMARRIPGKNSPSQVGDLIAEEYALLYETAPGVVRRSAHLRAQAAALRDAEAEAPDWDEIDRLLTESYVALHEAVASEP